MITNREIVLIAIVAFLLGVIVCQTFSPPVMTAVAQTPVVAGQKYQQRCEYIHKYVHMTEAHEQSINEYLNLKSQSGWKLVSVSLHAVAQQGTNQGSTPYFCFVKEL